MNGNIEGMVRVAETRKRARKLKPWCFSHLPLLCLLLSLSSCFYRSEGQVQETGTGNEFVIFEGGFDDLTNMNCSTALSTGGFLSLAPDSPSNVSISSGRCLHSLPVHLLDPKDPSEKTVLSFSTTFTFTLDGSHQNDDYDDQLLSLAGFAFFIVADSNPSTHEAQDGTQTDLQYLGLLNPTSNNKNSSHTFAVEFDIYNPLFVPMFNDPRYDHVGINLNSMNSSFIHQAGYYNEACVNKSIVQTFTPKRLTSGSITQAWVDYDGVNKILAVYLGGTLGIKPGAPLLNESGVDLSHIIKDKMYIGFSCAGVGSQDFQRSFLYAWSFNTSGPVELLYTSSAFPSEVIKPNVTNCGLTQPLDQKGMTVNSMLEIAIPSALGVVLLLGLVGFCFLLREKRALREKYRLIELEELEYGPIKYTYKELRAATKDFDPAKILGFGGFGSVYLGVLPMSGSTVAVKRMSANSQQTEREFVAEIRIIGRLRHRNLVLLAGWCHEKEELLLVYEFMPNGSLDQYLFTSSRNDGLSRPALQWIERFQILTGVATALLYLHEEWEQRVVHRDVKASNVLLDKEFNARLGDFGLARSYGHSDAPESTVVAGTPGYLPPEATQTLRATPEVDVFSFGVVALETVCGRPAVDTSLPMRQVVLVKWVRELYSKGRLLDAVDPRLGDRYEKGEVLMVLKIGILCTCPDPDARPNMRRVVLVFKGEAPIPALR